MTDPEGGFSFLAEVAVSCLHQHHHPSGTGSGTVEGWARLALLILCSRISRPRGLERKALKEEEGPWKEIGEQPILRAVTCLSRTKVRRVPGALSSNGGSLCVVHMSWGLVWGCMFSRVCIRSWM